MDADSSASDVGLRQVDPGDIEAFYRYQMEPEANAMAAFPARERDAHIAHWNKILNDPSCITRTITIGDEVAGNIGSWVQDGQREIGYWIGKQHWGRGIATAAVSQFLEVVPERPLEAWVAQHNPGSMRVLEKAGFVFDRDEDDHRVYRID